MTAKRPSSESEPSGAIVLWDDNPSTIDLLGFDAVVAPVLAAVRMPDLDPLTIGVHGPWGGGKSTILGLLEIELANDAYLVVRTNPWEYDDQADVKGTLIAQVLANTFDEQESQALYDRYHIPASGHVFWGSALANIHPGKDDTYVDYHNDSRPPLLFIVGRQNHLFPPKVGQSNAKHYKSKSVTEIVEFDGPHLLPAIPGWEAVADFALGWALKHAAAAPAS